MVRPSDQDDSINRCTPQSRGANQSVKASLWPVHGEFVFRPRWESRIAATMLSPAIRSNIDILGVRRFDWSLSRQRRVSSVVIVKLVERHQLQFQIRCRPEQQMVQAFGSNRADQSLDKWMRQQSIRNCFYLADIKNA